MSIYSSIEPNDKDLIDVAYGIDGVHIRLWVIDETDTVELTIDETKVLIDKLQEAIRKAAL